MLEQYADLLARVRKDGRWHSIRSLVQPADPEVMAVAEILAESSDFVAACQDFVDSFTTYKREVGDYWATPAETMAPVCPVCHSHDLIEIDDENDIYLCSCGWQGKPIQAGDCDDKAILLASLLRYKMPPDAVYCAFGIHRMNGKPEGHMWVIAANGWEDRTVEATMPSRAPLLGDYELMAFFNDRYAFAYPEGIREFDLLPVEVEIYAY